MAIRGTKGLLNSHPLCCFCGGRRLAATRDHIPSIQMFALKRRPKGLEFPACNECNQFTKHAEQVAAVMARMFPDPPTEDELDELSGMFRSVMRHSPGLLESLQPTRAQNRRADAQQHLLPSSGHIMNARGNFLNARMGMFGCKLGLALHYHVTDVNKLPNDKQTPGMIVPISGGVLVKWNTNFEKYTGNFPDFLYDLFSNPKTLKQGKWSADDQFLFDSVVTEDGKLSAHHATFRDSFAITAYVDVDGHKSTGLPGFKIYRPGYWLPKKFRT